MEHQSPKAPSQLPHPPIHAAQPSVPTPQSAHPSPRAQPVQTTPIPAPATVKKKPGVVVDSTASSSTPPASASIPANPPTPSHAANSPQTPKSPKVKAPSKTKQQPRRKSSTANAKGQPSAPVSAPTPTSAAVPATVPTPSTPAAAAVTPSADQPSPVVRTPDSGIKRKRNDEGPSTVIDAPSPKKTKTEWEGPESDALVKKRQEVEDANTDEDATKFLENMTEMFAMATSDGKEIPPEVSETLSQILSNFPFEDANGLRGSSPALPLTSDGSEFFDFTMYGQEDHGSKAPTPDLLPTMSAKPSPSSGSDADSTHGPSTSTDTATIVDSGIEDTFDGSDPLRSGMWTAIDGGEGSYWNVGPWKWEGTMPTLEQPWAISDR